MRWLSVPIGRQLLSRYIWTSQFSPGQADGNPISVRCQCLVTFFMCNTVFVSPFLFYLCAFWALQMAANFILGVCDKTAKYDRQQHEMNEWICNEAASFKGNCSTANFLFFSLHHSWHAVRSCLVKIRNRNRGKIKRKERKGKTEKK